MFSCFLNVFFHSELNETNCKSIGSLVKRILNFFGFLVFRICNKGDISQSKKKVQGCLLNVFIDSELNDANCKSIGTLVKRILNFFSFLVL